jgi:hypothetical protein
VSFSSVLEVALAGTLRSGPPAPLVPTGTQSAEAELLRAAAFEGLRRLAGRPLAAAAALAQSEHHAADGPRAPAETLPQAPASAAARLFFLLDHQPDLIPEWLQLADQHHVRAPFAALPELLDLGRTTSDPTLQRRIRNVGGERLGWLAMHNSDWSFAATSAGSEKTFANGSRDQRRQTLQHIRESDPSRARTLLADAWELEPATSRAALLEVFGTHLSVADEPLLERALGAARKEIRDTALGFLRRLPDSHFAARWRTRAQHAVIFDEPRKTLSVHPPTEPPADWIADGLDPAVPKGKGATAWLLEQLMTNCPPDTWPPEAFNAFSQNVWATPLVTGLAAATVSYQHMDWCVDLVRHAATHRNAQEALPYDPGRLIGALESDRAEAIFMELARAEPTSVTATQRIGGLQHRWSPGFSRYMVQEYFPPRLSAAPYSVVGELRIAASALDPSTLEHLQQLLDKTQDPMWLQSALERLVDTVDLRASMAAEFDPAPASTA